uniref:Exonuclease domain-containing protein n=1 Tax=Rhabditophanes sp. KR3021 TaxID=114890 RepID=A0AC35U1F1_9BILA
MTFNYYYHHGYGFQVSYGNPAVYVDNGYSPIYSNHQNVYPLKCALPSPLPTIQKYSKYKYLVVVDFEATCQDFYHPHYEHEIIDFPAILIDTTNSKTVSIFHQLVRPLRKPHLSNLCKKLTGIKQADIDQADSLNIVWYKFMNWLELHTECSFNGERNDFLMVTDGHNDLAKFLFRNLFKFNIVPERAFLRYADIRHILSPISKRVTNKKLNNMKLKEIIEAFRLNFKGDAHSGLSDALNITELLQLTRFTYEVRINPTHVVDLRREMFTYGTKSYHYETYCG